MAAHAANGASVVGTDASASADTDFHMDREVPLLGTSLVEPRHFSAYHRLIRMQRREGYLHRLDTSGRKNKRDSAGAELPSTHRVEDAAADRGHSWTRRWFLLEDGCLYKFNNQSEARTWNQNRAESKQGSVHSTPIELSSLLKVGTCNNFGDHCFQLQLPGQKLIILRAGSRAERDQWLFAFHKSIARIITMLLSGSSSTSMPGTLNNHERGVPVRNSTDFTSDRSLSGDDLTPQSTLRMNSDRDTSMTMSTTFSDRDTSLSGFMRMRLAGNIASKTFGPVEGNAAASTFSPDSPKSNCSDSSHRSSFSEMMFDMLLDEPQGISMGGTSGETKASQENRASVRAEGGEHADQGGRSRMEDAHHMVEDITCPTAFARGDDPRSFFYGIYDGHDGALAAHFARDEIMSILTGDDRFWAGDDETVSACLSDAFGTLDSRFIQTCCSGEQQCYAGTTAVAALVRGNRLWVATLGDSEAIMCRNGGAVVLSTKQSPGRPDERERIEKCNGWVHEEKVMFIARLRQMDLDDPFIRKYAEERVGMQKIYRVNGELAVSRAIGDAHYKQGHGLESYDWFFPQAHSHHFSGDLVIATPEIKCMEIIPSDEFIVLACDGLWDVVDYDLAARYAKQHLDNGCTPREAAAELSALALRLGSTDNVTVMVVKLHHEV